MWELKHEAKDGEIEEYWVLTKDGKPMGAFFEKVLADRILAFLTSKWLTGKVPKML